MRDWISLLRRALTTHLHQPVIVVVAGEHDGVPLGALLQKLEDPLARAGSRPTWVDRADDDC